MYPQLLNDPFIEVISRDSGWIHRLWIEPPCIEELLHLADMYDIQELKTATAMKIETKLSNANVFKILEAADKFNATNVYDKCVDFIEKNYKLPELVNNGILDKFPQMAVTMLKRHCTSIHPSDSTHKYLQFY